MEELKHIVINTSDLQEACIQGYNAGYRKGVEDSTKSKYRCYGCMGSTFDDCGDCRKFVNLDAPVYVRDSKHDKWLLRYFHSWDKGKIVTWAGGTTSFNTYCGEVSTWNEYVFPEDTLLPEIALIRDRALREFALFCEERLPEYFYQVPASSSGKHHPSYALGEGGLLRHTKAAVKIAEDLLHLEQYKNSTYLDHDTIIFALIFHDSIKQGFKSSGHTEFSHPNYASQFIKDCYDEYRVIPEFQLILTVQLVQIRDCIESHMGQWNTSKYEEGIKLHKPMTVQQEFVHMCDYLASRKYLEVSFDIN